MLAELTSWIARAIATTPIVAFLCWVLGEIPRRQRPATVAALLVYGAALWVGFAWVEAHCYSHLTGHSVSTWDAMFADYWDQYYAAREELLERRMEEFRERKRQRNACADEGHPR